MGSLCLEMMGRRTPRQSISDGSLDACWNGCASKSRGLLVVIGTGWDRIQKSFPNYKKGDVGHVFFVYDYKHSGEHRVRLVFDGSRQNPETYTDTYAPTARGESVRLFHIYSVEE